MIIDPGRKDVRPFRRPSSLALRATAYGGYGLARVGPAEPLAVIGSMLWTAGEAGISGDKNGACMSDVLTLMVNVLWKPDLERYTA